MPGAFPEAQPGPMHRNADPNMFANLFSYKFAASKVHERIDSLGGSARGKLHRAHMAYMP
jgi:hypothetical protein